MLRITHFLKKTKDTTLIEVTFSQILFYGLNIRSIIKREKVTIHGLNLKVSYYG
jgi:hypothetical protein